MEAQAIPRFLNMINTYLGFLKFVYSLWATTYPSIPPYLNEIFSVGPAQNEEHKRSAQHHQVLKRVEFHFFGELFSKASYVLIVV